MNKNLKIKLIADILMAIFFILLMNIQITGVNIHEWIGIMFALIISAHIILNLKWIQAVFKNLSKAIIKSETKKIFTVDIILFLNMFIITISGILISNNIFKQNLQTLINIHIYSSYIAIFVLTIHIVLHIKHFKNYFKMLINIDFKKLIIKVLGGAIGVVGIYALVLNVYSKNNSGLVNLEDIRNSTTITNKKEKYETNHDSSNATDNTSAAVDTLNDYLGKLVCTGCHKRCSLLAPKCSTGVAQAEYAKQEYNLNVNYTN